MKIAQKSRAIFSFSGEKNFKTSCKTKKEAL